MPDIESLTEAFNRLELERDALIARALSDPDAMQNTEKQGGGVVVNPGGDPEINIDIQWWAIINAWKFKPVGLYVCPGCRHRVQFFARHIGFVVGGHRQIACGCYVAKRAADTRGRGAGMCGCVWTRDDRYGPIRIP